MDPIRSQFRINERKALPEHWTAARTREEGRAKREEIHDPYKDIRRQQHRIA